MSFTDSTVDLIISNIVSKEIYDGKENNMS